MKYIICDIDGTLAEKYEDRDIYDASLCHKDKVIKATQTILRGIESKNEYADDDSYIHIIYMSGRGIDCEKETRDWLEAKAEVRIFDNIKGFERKFYNLYMRKRGDNREDAVVKKELLEQFLKDYKAKKEDILFVIDDRLSVIDMWLKEGLFVFNVNNGRGDF
ncbi:MAG: hypothetical protein FWE18_00255 [Alphaproteobacteria bacterium]|nr:hypothetical protein [Alphaproteobacteria bacterium]